MLEYSRLNNQEYYNAVMNSIESISDKYELEDILKSLSYRLHYKDIEPEKARELIAAVNKRLFALTNNRGTAKENKPKSLHLSPTSVSNRAGSISIAFLAVNIAITTIMYALLILGRLIG